MTSGQTKQSEVPGRDAKGREEMENRLTSPVLTFDLATEIERLHQEEHWLKDGRISETLVKHSDFRIVLILMQAGMLMQDHQADARISIQALSGRLLVQLTGQAVELSEGHLLVLEKSLSHDVKALEQSAFLLTISWPHGVDPELR